MLAASPSLAELARSYELTRKRAPRSLAALPPPASPNLPPARRRTVAATHGRLAGAAAGDAIRAARHHRWAPARRPRRRSALADPRPGPRALVTPATERRRTGGARRPGLNRYPVHSNPQAQGTEAAERPGSARGRSQLEIRARSSGDRALPCGGRGRTFESCRAHGSTKPFSRARNAEKCTIRPSYSASVRTREADEPCSEGAGSEGVLGLADRGPGGLGAPEDGLLQDGAKGRDDQVAPEDRLGSEPEIRAISAGHVLVAFVPIRQREQSVSVLIRHRVAGMTPSQYDEVSPALVEKLRTQPGFVFHVASRRSSKSTPFTRPRRRCPSPERPVGGAVRGRAPAPPLMSYLRDDQPVLVFGGRSWLV